MSVNLGLSKNHATLIMHYFRTQQLLDTTYCACRHGQLVEDEEYEYQKRWLAKYNLAVVEEVCTKTQEVVPDQDETLPNKQESKDVTAKILRWNFPTFGRMYLDILRNFINDCYSTKLKEICKKEPSFVGFWLEGMFVSYIIRRRVQFFQLSALKNLGVEQQCMLFSRRFQWLCYTHHLLN